MRSLSFLLSALVGQVQATLDPVSEADVDAPCFCLLRAEPLSFRKRALALILSLKQQAGSLILGKGLNS
jgi:hypothetical protein